MKRLLLLSVVLVMFIGVASLRAHGTAANTVLSNAKTLGQLSSLITNAGNISAKFTNASGAVSYAMVMGTIATTHVQVGYDLSQLPGMTLSMTQLGTAGSFVSFTVIVTNFGNAMDNLRIRVTNRGATAGWTPPYQSYSLLTNTFVALGTNIGINYTYANLPANNSLLITLRVYIPVTMADGSTNRVQFWLDDSAPGAGDSWPSANAILPATPDVGNVRDHQTASLYVRVSGPILRISKTVNLTSALPYDFLTYTIAYTNAGTATALGVVIQDALPYAVTNITTLRIFTNNSAISQSLTLAVDGDDGEVVGRKVTVRPHAGNLPVGNFGKIKFNAQIK